jgi:predicted SnoaL-like aldol condensation-catalyzing enzyme
VLCSATEAAHANRIIGDTYLQHTPAADRAEHAVRALPGKNLIDIPNSPNCG